MIEKVVFYSCDTFLDELRIKKEIVKVKKETEKLLYLDRNGSYFSQVRKDDIGKLNIAFGLKMFLLEENDESFKKAVIDRFQSKIYEQKEIIELFEKCIEQVKGCEL